MFWFINWNAVFNCSGLFLPNKHSLLAIWQPEKKGPLVLYLTEMLAVCMLRQLNMLCFCHFFVYYNKRRMLFFILRVYLFIYWIYSWSNFLQCYFILLWFLFKLEFWSSCVFIIWFLKLTTLKCLKYFTQGLLASCRILMSQFIAFLECDFLISLILMFNALKCFIFVNYFSGN